MFKKLLLLTIFASISLSAMQPNTTQNLSEYESAQIVQDQLEDSKQKFNEIQNEYDRFKSIYHFIFLNFASGSNERKAINNMIHYTDRLFENIAKNYHDYLTNESESMRKSSCDVALIQVKEFIQNLDTLITKGRFGNDENAHKSCLNLMFSLKEKLIALFEKPKENNLFQNMYQYWDSMPQEIKLGFALMAVTASYFGFKKISQLKWRR